MLIQIKTDSLKICQCSKCKNCYFDSENDKKFYCLTYENPDEVIKEFTKEGKEEYNNFNPYELPFQKLMEYEKVIPWRLIPSKLELSEESDKLMIFTIYSFNNK